MYLIYFFICICNNTVSVSPISSSLVNKLPPRHTDQAITNKQQTVGKRQNPRCSHVSVDKGKIQATGAPAGPLRALLARSIQRLACGWRHRKRRRWRRDIRAWPAEQCHGWHRTRVRCWWHVIRRKYGSYITHAVATNFTTHDISTSTGGQQRSRRWQFFRRSTSSFAGKSVGSAQPGRRPGLLDCGRSRRLSGIPDGQHVRDDSDCRDCGKSSRTRDGIFFTASSAPCILDPSHR